MKLKKILISIGCAVLSVLIIVIACTIVNISLLQEICDVFNQNTRLLSLRLFSRPILVSKDVKIIDIDYESCQLRKRMPSNLDIATEIKELHDKGASCIFLDISMDYKQDSYGDSLAALFLSKIDNLGFAGLLIPGTSKGDILNHKYTYIEQFRINVKGIDDFIDKKYYFASLPLSQFIDGNKFFGFANVFGDQKGRIADLPLFFNLRGVDYPSVLLSLYCFVTKKQIKECKIHKRFITFSEDTIYLDNKGVEVPENDYAIEKISFFKVPYLSFDSVKGKTFLIGRSCGGNDLHFLKNGKFIFGTEILGKTLLSMLSSKKKHYLPLVIEMLISCFFCFVISFLLLGRFPIVGILCAIFEVISLIILNAWFLSHGWIYNYSLPIISILTTICITFVTIPWVTNKYSNRTHGCP